MSPSAAIDIGSNTIRLLIGNIKDEGIEHIFSDRRITRLAEGISKLRRLREENIEASISVLKDFSSIIKGHKVTSVGAVATSALREADNSDIFIHEAFVTTGISVEVISGAREAELILKGILISLPDSSPLAQHSLFIVDIGGGSTEWIFCRDRQAIDMGSLPVGVVKLYENFINTDPVSEADISALDKEILSSLEILTKRVGQYIDNETRFIGTAGTFTTLASIDLQLRIYQREKIHLHRMPLIRLRDLSKRLSALSLRERKKVAGLEPRRADLIIPGVQFTINIMKNFKFDELTVSDYGLLEGVLLETVNRTNEKDIREAKKP